MLIFITMTFITWYYILSAVACYLLCKREKGKNMWTQGDRARSIAMALLFGWLVWIVQLFLLIQEQIDWKKPASW